MLYNKHWNIIYYNSILGAGGGDGLVLSCNLFFCNCSPPGSSVHEIFQARILDWIAISFSRGFSQPRDGTHISCIGSRFFTTESPGKPGCFILVSFNSLVVENTGTEFQIIFLLKYHGYYSACLIKNKIDMENKTICHKSLCYSPRCKI